MTDPWRPWEHTPAPAAAPGRRFRDTAAVIRQVQETEHRWFAQGDPASPTLGWMPFQLADFLSIVFECVPEMGGREFLDVGCGPGTKMLLARHFFGLAPSGIEINPAMAEAAAGKERIWTGDALTAPPDAYPRFDLIWLYRPFRDPVLEQKLEERVMSEMKPGAILAGGGWETCPGHSPHRWVTVVDDWELRRGAWLKPRPVSTLKL